MTHFHWKFSSTIPNQQRRQHQLEFIYDEEIGGMSNSMIFLIKGCWFESFFPFFNFFQFFRTHHKDFLQLLTSFDLQRPLTINKTSSEFFILQITKIISGSTSGFSFHSIHWCMHLSCHLHDKLLPSKKWSDWMFLIDHRHLLVGIEILWNWNFEWRHLADIL